jgi:anti-sigma B factor antagonist
VLGGPPGSQDFKNKIYELIDRKITKVVVDLSDVSRMNSSGLGILISALTSLKNENGNMKLAAIDETMKGILIMTKLNTIFETYETAEGAAKSF